MKSFLKITGVTIVIALVVQTLINFGVIDFNKDNLDYEQLQKILGNSPETETDEFQEEPELPGQEYDDSHLQKGDEYLEKGLQSLAMTEYVESAKKENDNPEAFTKIGKIHFENGETQKARENFVKAIQRKAKHP